jgi:hypothetical protein
VAVDITRRKRSEGDPPEPGDRRGLQYGSGVLAHSNIGGESPKPPSRISSGSRRGPSPIFRARKASLVQTGCPSLPSVLDCVPPLSIFASVPGDRWYDQPEHFPFRNHAPQATAELFIVNGSECRMPPVIGCDKPLPTTGSPRTRTLHTPKTCSATSHGAFDIYNSASRMNSASGCDIPLPPTGSADPLLHLRFCDSAAAIQVVF